MPGWLDATDRLAARVAAAASQNLSLWMLRQFARSPGAVARDLISPASGRGTDCAAGRPPRGFHSKSHNVDGSQAGGEEQRYVRGHAAGRPEHGGAGESRRRPGGATRLLQSTPPPLSTTLCLRCPPTPLQALEKYTIEKDVAAYIKKEFDVKHNPTWHCIVGRNFGGCLGAS